MPAAVLKGHALSAVRCTCCLAKQARGVSAGDHNPHSSITRRSASLSKSSHPTAALDPAVTDEVETGLAVSKALQLPSGACNAQPVAALTWLGIFRINWRLCLASFLLYTVTISIFPGFLAGM